MSNVERKSDEEINLLTGAIIAAAIEVHRHLGPGFLESVYEECLVHELRSRKFSVEAQKNFPIKYKGIILDRDYRLDILVNNQVIIEVKSVSSIEGIHKAQLLSYLKMHGENLVGLLINFNVNLLTDGIRRMKL